MHRLARPRTKPRGMPPYSAVCIRNLRVNPYKFWETDAPVQREDRVVVSIRRQRIRQGNAVVDAGVSRQQIGMDLSHEPGLRPRSADDRLERGRRNVGRNIDQGRCRPGCRRAPSATRAREVATTWAAGTGRPTANTSWSAPRRVLEKGADAFQHDEAGLESTWRCYCDQCVNGFPDWLKQNVAADTLAEMGIAEVSSFDYRVSRESGKSLQ